LLESWTLRAAQLFGGGSETGPRLDDLHAYVGFTSTSAALLRAFLPRVEPHVGALVDDFYDAVARSPAARAALTGGARQVERLKDTLADWLRSALQGPYDEAYVQARARIGRAHVRIGLPQAVMFTAMNRLRTRLTELALAPEPGAPEEPLATRLATAQAVDQLLDLELALMLETYREDLVERIRVGERLATVGEFAASIGHELRSPLGVMESSLFLLRQQLEALGAAAHPGVHKHLERIGAEIARSAQAITNMLSLARSLPPRRRPLPVRALVAQALAAAALPDTVHVEAAIADELEIHADPDQLAHVVANLLTNAHESMKEAGLPDHEARPEIRVEARRDPGGISIRVRDQGPGVPQALRERIFEPLFTTKAYGTGLGLALSRRIADAHGGRLELEAGPSGATFVLHLPDAAA
jgi:signal transduction histidine kinase